MTVAMVLVRNEEWHIIEGGVENITLKFYV